MRSEAIGSCELTREDCMALMERYPDKYFDLAIVDPPYGDNGGKIEHIRHKRTEKSVAYNWTKKYSMNKSHEWDKEPAKEYFEELFRVAASVIIWGGNYFALPPSRNFIVWRKPTISETFTMAMAEYAWANIPGNAKVIDCAPQDKGRFHPTQKPVYLYKKLLQWYAKPGNKILDTYLGSGTHAIACYDMGFQLTACEIDEYYFDNAVKRLREFAKQGTFNFGGAE